MADLQQQIMQILGRPQLAGLATVTEDGKPWVRYVMIITSEDMTLRCATFVQARKVSQIQAQPEVHLTCGITDPMERKPYLQIQGKAVLKTDKTTRHAFWTDMLKQIFDGPDDPNFGIIEITPYRIELCTMGSYEPQVWIAES